ncbi:YhcN/YlaJ family sporulation lipoprotein [Paenibacillus shirakamiensis]|uniref:YhcN/YlaJ family sporulation lipoprotein n=1 Tax=Paenibacillus shirakamiensis TaxID=1265935 RepID=A0ABS4JBW5_9BACL|nr:YhcN/YlaJ family sporulation lipoprotein [Paenibacillus shirakamiensis]MBP1999198.1 YhcN/YlaJ family sporulation lipoprotein [Paenibacillus shirakamiensis]
MRTWLCFLLTALLLTGCGSAAKQASPSPQSQQNYNARMSSEQSGGTGQTLQGSSQTQQVPLQTHLETLVKQVPGVNNAHCVVFGKTAVVGLDVDANLDRSRVGTIKYSVAEALRKDPRGVNAIVTADIGLSTRLSEIGKSIREGHPISGFGNELSDIVGRIIPQLPRDVNPVERPAQNTKSENTKQLKQQQQTHEKSNKLPSNMDDSANNGHR